MIDIKNLTYSYGNGINAINDISFSLSENESVALIGANGAGKSTLLQLILGLLKPLSGGISCFDTKSLLDIRQKIGYVFQNPDHQLFCGTVYDDIAFGPLNAKLSEVDLKVEKTLETLDIIHLRNRPPYKLSAGEKRLAAIATVLVAEPLVLLMDEPSSDLDPRARRGLISLLNNLPQSKIIATHDLDLAIKTCEKTLILHNGGIAFTGNSADILTNEAFLMEYGL